LDLCNSSIGNSTRIVAECRWKKFQSKPNFPLLNGSYCVTSGEFRGTETSPPIAIVDLPSPEYWDELSENPIATTGQKNFLFTRNSASIISSLRQQLSGKPIEYRMPR
jgi:hypothetical protein